MLDESKRKFLIGSDPEFFLRKKNTGSLISAIPYIKGGKHDPIALPSGAGLQADNVAVEFATLPAKSASEFVETMRQTFHETIRYLPKGTELAVLPSANFDPEELKDPAACTFGCSPDYCAWELKVNDTPTPQNSTFRSCGGHIHVGGLDAEGNPTHEDTQFLLSPMGKVATVRVMDLFHGVISTILDSSKEAVERRTLYGKAGCHRPTDYGIEYRALSNWWTRTPYSSMLISALTDVVVDLIISSKIQEVIDEISPEQIEDHITLLSEVGGDEIQRIINEGDAEAATTLLENVLIKYLSEEAKEYLTECTNKLADAGSVTKEWAINA